MLKVRFVSPANIEFDEAVRYYDHQLPKVFMVKPQPVTLSMGPTLRVEPIGPEI